MPLIVKIQRAENAVADIQADVLQHHDARVAPPARTLRRLAKAEARLAALAARAAARNIAWVLA